MARMFCIDEGQGRRQNENTAEGSSHATNLLKANWKDLAFVTRSLSWLVVTGWGTHGHQ